MVGIGMSVGPPKMFVTNLDSSETLEAMFNPTEVKIALAPIITRLAIPTLSHQPLNFGQTANITVDLELRFAANYPGAGPGFIQKVEAFLLSAFFPPDVVRTLSDASLASLLLVWPGWIALKTVLTKYNEKATEFARPPSDPIPTFVIFELTFEVQGAMLIGSNTVRLVGLQWGQ